MNMCYYLRMDIIQFEDFIKLDIRIARIIKVEEVEGADKLLKLTLDVGDPEDGGLGERVIASGIKEWYTSDNLIGKLIPYLANLEPREIRGVLSQGMLLAAGGDTAILLHPDKEVSPGTKIR